MWKNLREKSTAKKLIINVQLLAFNIAEYSYFLITVI